MVHQIWTRLCVFSAAAALLLLTASAGQSQVTGALQTVHASVGDDVILPCHLETATDAVTIAFEWTRPDLNPRFVFVWRFGDILLDMQHPAYKGRTSLLTEKLKSGDISLRLAKVKPFDEGKYRCYIPGWGKEYFVHLVVGSVSNPFMVGIDKVSNGLVLQCGSKGWYPEPEVSWLDSEGDVLSAGPTETVRGPDGLYTVSSRVTVEKRDRNNFTCRVQQKNINQIREIRIHATDNFIEVHHSSTTVIGLAVSLAFSLLLNLGACCIRCKKNR